MFINIVGILIIAWFIIQWLRMRIVKKELNELYVPGTDFLDPSKWRDWSKRLLGASSVHNLNLMDIAFKNEQIGWITAWDIVKRINVIYVTTDGGETWTRQLSPTFKTVKLHALTTYGDNLWLAGTKVLVRKD